jgi:hypothetical protein
MDDLDLDQITWPDFQRLCYMVGFSHMMDTFSHEERIKIFALRQKHYDETDGKPMRRLSTKVWSESRGNRPDS